MIPRKLRKKSEFFRVGNTAIYEPDNNVSVEHAAIIDEESGQTRDGVMHLVFKRGDVRRITFVYMALTSEEYDFMTSLMQGKQFVFWYYEGGKEVSMNAYCETHTYNIRCADKTSKRAIYADLQITVQEL